MIAGIDTLNKLKKWALDLIFPEVCLGCQKKGDVLCENCVLSIRRAERETDTRIYACFDYRDPVIKRAIWNFKLYKRMHLASTLGGLLHEVMSEEVSGMRMYASGQSILVTPVPLSKSRKKTRGYNQAERIARSFCYIGNTDSKNTFELRGDIVTKVRDTSPQARIANRTKRLENIKGAFKINNESMVKGRTIIVIDDVTTTGGTLLELMKILKNAGAKKVVGFAVAH